MLTPLIHSKHKLLTKIKFLMIQSWIMYDIIELIS